MSTERLAVDWADRHDNLHLVRYEELTGHPPAAFRPLCSLLGEPYVAEALEEPAPNPDRWPVDPHLWGGIVQRTKQWQDYLSGTEAAKLQRRLAGVMAALGYEPYPVSLWVLRHLCLWGPWQGSEVPRG